MTPTSQKSEPSDASSQELASAYLIQPISDSAAAAPSVIPRRGPTQSVPGLDLPANCKIADDIFAKFGLPQYVGCITAEIRDRPIPFAFRTSETAKLTSLYAKWAPHILARAIHEMKPPVQTYNKISRLGWDVLRNPPNKREVLAQKFAEITQSGVDKYWKSYVSVGMRLQAEAKTKEREFLFLTADYQVVKRVIKEEDRLVDVSDVGPRVGSRFRGVNNMPLPNLYKQVLDTAIHNV